MEHPIKLAFMCGNYKAACKTPQGENALVIGQTVETGNDLLERGKTIHREIKTSVTVFSNNDHFLNGVRLAVLYGNLQPEDVEIYFFPNEDSGRPHIISIDNNGGLSNWPQGFFDAIEEALAQII